MDWKSKKKKERKKKKKEKKKNEMKWNEMKPATTAGPKDLAGFIEAPVKGTPTQWRVRIVKPNAKGVNFPGPYSFAKKKKKNSFD